MTNLEQKKKEIASRLADMRHVPSEREEYIKKVNNPWGQREKSVRASIWKDRHDRRHGLKPKKSGSYEEHMAFHNGPKGHRGRAYND